MEKTMIYNFYSVQMQTCLAYEAHPWPFDQQREQPREEEGLKMTNVHALIPQSQDKLLQVY
jgi:hypothetical protein